MNPTAPLFAAHFLPRNFLLIAGVYFAVAVVIVSLSLHAATRFGGSRTWVVGGMILGGIGSAALYVGLLPVGVVLGAVAGCLATVAAAMLQSCDN